MDNGEEMTHPVNFVLIEKLFSPQISDDEDETHPNIDTPSLFRWRHQARVERMEEQEREKKQLEEIKRNNAKKAQELKEKLTKQDGNLDELKKSLDEVEKEQARLRREEEELKKKEKMQPWNVDTISKDGFKKVKRRELFWARNILKIISSYFRRSSTKVPSTRNRN